MININSYKLTPAITATWGDITGNVSNQEDLVEYINEHGTAAWGSISGNISDQSDLMSTLGSYATESWVSSQQFATESWVSEQGYLTSVPSEYATQSWVSEQGYLTSSALTGYATESWVSEQGYLTSTALSGYATESWVSSQGYLTSETLPSDIATQSWVSEQGYLTSTSLKTVNNQSLVGEGNIEIGGLTPQQEEAIAPLVDKSTGVLTADVKTKYKYVGFAEAPSSDQYGQIWVYDINNEVYMINWMNLEDDGIYPYIYKWNTDSWKFEVLMNNDQPVVISGLSSPVVSAVTDPHVIWSDTQGRYYFNNTHTITFTETEWIFTEHQMGGTLQTYNGKKSNIVKLLNGIYMLYGASTASQSRAWKFNEETQVFDAYGSGASFAGYSITNWYRYVFYYNGTPYYTRSNSANFFYKFNIAPTRISVTAIALADRPFPLSFTYDGQNFIVTGDRIRKVTVNNEDIYIYYYGQYAFRLNTESTPKTWEYLDLVRKDAFSYNTNGVEFGDLMFGFGYDEEVTGQVPVWNFSSKVIEDYGWDNSLDERLTAAEESLTSIEPLENTSEGILYTDVIEGDKENVKRSPTTSTLNGDYIYTTIGGIYLFQDLDLYKLNSDTLVFDYVTHAPRGNFQPLWMDNSGRLYQGSFLETDLTTGATTEVDLNIGEFSYDRNRCNIYNGSVGIWNVFSGGLRLFNEQQKKFIDGGYTLTLPEDYTGNISYDIRYVFTYKGHKLFHTLENKTYEVVDTNTGLTVTDVTGTYYPIPEFTIQPYFIFPTEDGNLRYANQNDLYFYTGSGSWQPGTTHITGWFVVGYAVSGNCVIGGISRGDSYYSVINFGPELKPTYWSPVKDVAVDLDSYQRIQATKIFDSIQASNIQINYISPYGGNTTNFDLGINNTNASKMEFTVPGMFTLNGTNIATTDKCFVNRSYTTSGPRYEGICSTAITDYYYYFKTPSGRLIYDYDNNAYEFDGTQFTQLQTVTVHPQSNTFVIITDGLFAKDNSGNLIKWNDTTSNWEVLISLIQASETLWAADANTLRLGPVYKLDNTGGTYSWVEDPLGNYPFIGHTYFIGQNVYMMQDGSNGVYQYDESTKTFTFIGSTNNWPNGGHWFVFENELYYFGGDGNVHKIDPSQVGTDQWDVETNILYTYCGCLYVEYNNKLYLTNSNVTNSFGYCYDVTETAPVVPSTNGTYVLKAVRSGDQVTFSWVLES